MREGLTERWPNEQWPNVGCAQECPLDPVAGALRMEPGASPSQKKFAGQCSSSVSGMMENHNTHLTPGFTLHDLVPAPVNVASFRGLLGPGGFNSLHQMSLRQWNGFSPCGPRTSRTPLCSWGFALPTRAPPGRELRVAAFALPLFIVFVELKPSPFSFLPFRFSPCGRFQFSTFSPAAFGGGVLFPYSPPPPVSSSLCLQKQLPARRQPLSPQVHLSAPRVC